MQTTDAAKKKSLLDSIFDSIMNSPAVESKVCGHDIGDGLFAVLRQWESIRRPELLDFRSPQIQKTIFESVLDSLAVESGVCGHDVGCDGLSAIIEEWESIRTSDLQDSLEIPGDPQRMQSPCMKG